MEEANGRREAESEQQGDDARFDTSLRPRPFDEVVGQTALLDNLKVFVKAAGARREPLDHVLFCGPPGLGKTSLAHVIANELGAQIHVTSGPALERKGDLAGILTNLAEGDVLFIDEIHRLNPAIEENLYPAMETYTFDIVIGDGAGARAIKLPLKPATLIDKFGGGPVGVDTVATAVGEQPDTLEDVYEPFLMMEGFLVRTPRGRAATPRAYEHLGRKIPSGLQGSLL